MFAASSLAFLRRLAAGLRASAALALGPVLHGQGSLSPPATGPAPVMPTLAELSAQIDALEARHEALRAHLAGAEAIVDGLESGEVRLLLESTAGLGGSLPAWRTDTIDPRPVQNLAAALAFAPDGAPALAYRVRHRSGEGRLASLFFATLVDGAWQTETIDPAPALDAVPALAFDAAGRPVVAYEGSAGAGGLRLATRQVGGWEVLPTGLPAERAALAFGPEGEPSLAFFDTVQRHLRLAQRMPGGAWSTSVIDATTGAGEAPALAFGPDGRAAVAYRLTTSVLGLAEQSATGWQLRSLAKAYLAGGTDRVLAFAPDGEPTVLAEETGALALVRIVGTALVPAPIADSPLVSANARSLAYGPEGQAWVVLASQGGGELRLRRAVTGGGWRSSTVAGTAGATDPVLVFSPAGLPIITYFDPASGTLRAARLAVDTSAP
jgi:hypothetical protein